MDERVAPAESRFDELKRYVRWSDRDGDTLVALREHARPHFEEIAQEFYERIREHEEAHAVLRDEEQIARLQRSLVAWLERLLGGRYDESYFEQTRRIGAVHVRVGLPQRYMFTAMALIRASLTRIADRAAASGAPDARDAIARLLDVELAIMVDGYREDLVARIARANETDRHAPEHRHEQMFELGDAMTIVLDGCGKIILFNAEAERVTGYARDEARGQDLAELALPRDVREAEPDVFFSVESSRPRELELPLSTRSGKLRHVRFRVMRLPSSTPSGSPEFFVQGYDVTDARAAQLRDQQRERLAAVGTLAAGLAHEIRNPLNGAQLHVSFLERALKSSPSNADALEAVSIVRDEIKRLARLVTDFLDFARPRPSAFAPTSLRPLCERAVQLARGHAGEGMELRLDLPSAEVALVADADRLEQVLLNLLHNAVDAVASAGGRVVLRARRRPRHVAIEVEDDGPGLPSGDPPIFDAFFSTKPNGTGLGLAIAHRVVTDHGGVIEVESAPGRTVFRVVLPLDGAAAPTR